MRYWTPEERKKQAQAIRRWNPWKKSTGPRTAAGKARSSQNARTREGTKRHYYKMITDGLRSQTFCRKLFRPIMEEKNFLKRTIMIVLFRREDQRFRECISKGLRGLMDIEYGDGWCDRAIRS